MMLTALMRVTLASARVPGRAGALARAALNGSALGILSDAQLRKLDELYYTRAELYRTSRWNESGLMGWERRAVEETFEPGGRVVVVACGGGREVLALLRGGYDAIGFESHPQLCSYAETFLAERGFPGRALPVPRDALPTVDRCDAILIGWGAYSLIAPASRRTALLREAARALPRAGPILLSGFVQASHGRELRLTARIASATARIASAISRQGRTVRSYEPGDTLAPNQVHVFTPEEIAGEIQSAGFELRATQWVAMPDGVDYAYAIGRRR